MREVDIEELERDFEALLDAVERGEVIAIARFGRRVAQMRPVSDPEPGQNPVHETPP